MERTPTANPLAITHSNELDEAVDRALAVLAPLPPSGEASRSWQCARLALTAIGEANLTLRDAGAELFTIRHLRPFLCNRRFRQMIVAASTSHAVKEMFAPPSASYSDRGEAVQHGGLFEMLNETQRSRRIQPIIDRLNALGL